MQVAPEPLDLPREEAEAREALDRALRCLAPDRALLVRWRRDLRALLAERAEWRWWPAVDGPSAWHFLVHRQGPSPGGWAPTAAVRLGWREAFRLYREALSQARAGDPGAVATADEFVATVREELAREEDWLLPLYQERTGDARSPRELGYEREGIRRGLGRLEGLVREALAGTGTRRDLERFEIDVFHLVEHHVQRLEASVLPILELVR